MTLSTTASRANYPGAGLTGPFAFPFTVFAATDLLVTRRHTDGTESTLAYGADFSVAGVNTASGTVTLSAILLVGEFLSIRRAPSVTQPNSIRNLGQYFASTHESSWDRLAMVDQSQQDQIDRCLKLAETLDPGAFSLTLPNPEAGKVMTGTGTGFTMSALDSSAIALPGQSRTVTSVSSYLANNAVFNIRDYKLVADADDTLATQRAITAGKAFGGSGARVEWLGNLNISDTLFVDSYRIHVHGKGEYASSITFNPPAGARQLFKAQFSNAALEIAQGSFGHFSLIGGGTQQKIAFDLWDTSDFTIEHVTVSPGWTGNSGSSSTPSIGIRTNGRELTKIRNVTIFADRPIHIRVNPNSTATEAADHFRFTNLYVNCLVATEACILIDANCAPANMTFDGIQSWIGGKYGLDFTSGGTSGFSSTLIEFYNIRYEQSADATGYAVRWQAQSTQNIAFYNCHFGGGNNNGGALIRNAARVLFQNCTHTGVAGAVAFDVTTCDEVWRQHSFSQVGGACVITGLEEVFSFPQALSGMAAPNTAYYCSVALNAIRALKIGGAYKYCYKALIANGGVLNLPLLTQLNGLKVATVDVEGYSAVGPIEEGGRARVSATGVIIRTGSANFVTTNTAGKLCLFGNNPTAVINNTGQALSVVVDVTATYT